MLKSVTYFCRSQAYHNVIVLLTTPEKYSVHLSKSLIHRRNFFLLSHNCLFNHNSRNFVDKSSRIEKQENFVRFWQQCRQRLIHQGKSIKKLTAVLKCDKNDVKKLVEREPELFEENFDRTMEKVKLLVAEGIPPDVIRNNICVLRYGLPRLQTYLEAMKFWGIDKSHVKEFIAMFHESPKEFFNISKVLVHEKFTSPHGNRVLYLSNRLDCPISELLPKMLKKKFLFVRPVWAIEEVLDLYKEFGIKNEDILSDLSSLSSSIEPMRERLVKLREIGYYPIKPWLARYDYAKFEKAITYFLAEKEASHYDSREKFLAAKLNVDVDQIKCEFQRKYPYLFRIRALTFMKKLKFFLSQGYIPQDLLHNPYAFYPRISTIKNRINALRKLGIQTPRLPYVIKSEEEFEQLLHTLLADRGLKDMDQLNVNKDSHCEKNS